MRGKLLVLVAGAIVAASCGSSSYGGNNGPSFNPVASGPNTVLVPSGTYYGGTNGYTPPTLTVAAGTTVVWGNNDITEHTSVSDSGQWNSGNIESGKTFSQKFETPGTYTYHCSIHSFMHGTIVVQ